MPILPPRPVGDYNSREFRAEVNCSEKKEWNLINEGEVEAYYVGSQIRITRKSVEAYKLRNRYKPRESSRRNMERVRQGKVAT